MSVISFYEFDFSRHLPNLAFLSTEEKIRLESYLLPELKWRFAICRTLLRRALGQQLGLEPREVSITSGTFGKPETNGINFNLSHAHNKMVLALSFEGPLGIDIEKIDPDLCLEELEGRFFSRREKELLVGMSLSEKKAYFYKLWTMKEATLKEQGSGISIDLNELDTMNPAPHQKWTQIPTEPCYIAHLATSYEVSHICRYTLV